MIVDVIISFDISYDSSFFKWISIIIIKIIILMNSNNNNSNNNSDNNDRLAEMLAYVESITPVNTTPYVVRDEIVFGEELPGYFPIQGEARELERDSFNSVKALSNKITLQLYGDPKFGESVKALYIELFRRRVLQGKKGIRGMNRKGMLCACLMIVLRQNSINIELNLLVEAANKIHTNTADVTPRMVLKYMHFILELMQTNNNNNNRILNVRKDLRRIGIKFGYSGRNLANLVKKSNSVPQNIYSFHTPHIISAAIVYNHINRSERDKDTYKDLGVSKLSLSKALKRIYPNKNWDPEFSTKKKTTAPKTTKTSVSKKKTEPKKKTTVSRNKTKTSYRKTYSSFPRQ
jgi:hypothetical protein